MDVTIIYVNYNTEELLFNSIYSVIEKCTQISYEIVVIDNHSNRDISCLLTTKFDTLIRYFYLPANIGFASACNLGASHANGKYLFFLNPDTLLINNSVKILFDYMENSPTVGAACGNLFDAKLKPAYSYSLHTPGIFSEECDLLLFGHIVKHIKNFHFNTGTDPLFVSALSGADFFISKARFISIGMFDEDFFLYYEDTELSYRIKQSGLQLVNLPNSKIIHLDGQSSSDPVKRLSHSLKSRTLYYKKTRGATYNTISKLILLTALHSIRVINSVRNKNTSFAKFYLTALKISRQQPSPAHANSSKVKV